MGSTSPAGPNHGPVPRCRGHRQNLPEDPTRFGREQFPAGRKSQSESRNAGPAETDDRAQDTDAAAGTEEAPSRAEQPERAAR
ncbi:hypothetical protein SSCG_00782 [Streptomyces clavuligerus]|nr:hypothetical protein SSCG_00782 [Streptomyces clavuligerus]